MSIVNILRRSSAGNREMLTGSIFAMILKVLGMVSGYVFIIVSIHYTSIEAYGLFSLSLAFVQCTAILSRLGFDSSIVKYIAVFSNAKEFSTMNAVYSKGILLITAAGLAFSVVSFIAAPAISAFLFGDTGLSIPFRISTLSILPLTYLYYNAGALRGLKKITQYSSIVNAHFIAATLALVIIVWFFQPRYPLEISFSVGSAMVAVLSFYWWYVNPRYAQGAQASHDPDAYELLSTSLPMLSAGALYIINGWLDTFFLGIFSTHENVGIFNVVLKIAGITQIVLFAVTSISAPQFARLVGVENEQELRNLVQKSTKWIVWATIPLVVVIMVGFVPFARLFNVGFNPENYMLALSFLCMGQIINAFGGPSSHLLLMTGHQVVNGRIVFVSFIASIILNISLIPMYGINGAAFANMLGLMIRNVLFLIYTTKTLRMNAIFNPITDLSKLGRIFAKRQ